MRITKLAYKYLKTAVERAESDRKKLEDELNEYLSPVNNLDDVKKKIKMKENGFDIFKNTDDRVALDLAISDLHNILYYNEPRKL